MGIRKVVRGIGEGIKIWKFGFLGGISRVESWVWGFWVFEFICLYIRF